MPTPTFPALNARTELSAARMRGAEAFRRSQWEAKAATGIRYDPDPVEPFVAKTDAEIEADAHAEAVRHLAWEESPRGRFYRAVQSIQEGGGYMAESLAAEDCYRRGFSDERQPVDVAEVGRALEHLNPIAGSDARQARQALAELLIGSAEALSQRAA